MYDVERISKIISDIERFLRDLQEIDIERVGDLKEKKNFYSTSMILFSILKRTIDLADEIVMANNLGMPATYRDIFRLLAKNGYIDDTLMEKMSTLVFYRNLLAHEYQELTEKDVFNVLKRTSTIRQFLDIVKEIVRRDTR